MRAILRNLGIARESPWDNPEPIREELFSAERFEEHARSLASAQHSDNRRMWRPPLITRLRQNETALREAFQATNRAVEAGLAITPAAEWLADNYHIVQRHIREVRADLPPAYYRQLPKLVTGPFAGYPRVLGVSWAYVAHTDSRFDAEMLRRYVRAYQQVQPLTIGELWAVAITLRIVLIENLRRVAVRIEKSQASRQLADEMAGRILGLGGRDPEPITRVLADRSAFPATDAFAVQFVHMLRDQNPGVAPALAWLDKRLAQRGTTTDLAIRDEQERQVRATVTVRNIITSLRVISEIDWLTLFERMSPVDDLLSAAGQYKQMNFTTRNLYRTAIEELARSSGLAEVDIAQRVARSAQQAPAGADPRLSDPGYYLVAAGRVELEAEIGARPRMRTRLQRLNRRLGIWGYGAAIILVAALLLAGPLIALAAMDASASWLGVLALLGIIPALDAAVALVNSGVTRTAPVTSLPALELRGGVPPEARTLVAVPILLTSLAAIDEQIDDLEIHHLASLEGDVHFALLSDWADADSETAPDDSSLLEAASDGVTRLNAKYGPAPGGARFLLLHRRRVWNETERRWIGWERKRGKLHELNRLLRGATDTNFITAEGKPPTVPANVRYVITLDADTKLPRDTVRRLIGKMAHPLNLPRFDPQLGRVVEGYGVLQPRITASLPTEHDGTLFQRIFSSASGIDPYAAAVSDVYQDLFGEGSYAGKGIYDVDAFEAALAGRVPDSTLLSHDLFEGIFARAGLASDVEVVEEFPARYDVASQRHHRWARGDWQLLPWILGIGRGAGPVPSIGRAKMIDNLRRSLTAPACLLGLLAGWAMPLPAASLWTGFLLVVMGVPALIPLVDGLLNHSPGSTLRSRLGAFATDFRLTFTRWLLLIIFLADQAWLMGDAIVRTLIRLTITRRHLLEWVPAAMLASGREPGTLGFYRKMAGAVLIALVSIAATIYLDSGSWPLALGLALPWIASPAFARWISASPTVPRRLLVTPAAKDEMRRIARRTWRYFETFVTPTDNMLPPDNFQEEPTAIVAHRTSPTNIGMYLLSIVSARDFGWIGTIEAIERIEATMATMARLARYRGHLFNWYDTRDLHVLEPQYVSSVDSGNLAGHLIVLASACREWAASAPNAAVCLAGVQDSIGLAWQAIAEIRRRSRSSPPALLQVGGELELLAAQFDALAGEAPPNEAQLAGLAALAGSIAEAARVALANVGEEISDDLLFWTEAITATIASHRRDLTSRDESNSLAARLLGLEEASREAALAMDFGFLLDDDRKLLTIGYSASSSTIDANCYDLLASEARLASFIAIAKGELPVRHWFRLGRAVTPVKGGPVLVSWSGSMFEYLMPTLIMHAPSGSLLERTEQRIVGRQIEYGRQQDVPWGISESSFNARDLEFTYQYSNFGVPGLGLKRGLGENRVIAPYATALAAMIEPEAAIRNFRRIEAAGGNGRYGFYEALDYTPGRVPATSKLAVVRSFMAHHQGMTIVALANAVFGGVMRERFHAEPMVRAAELLLQERMPRQIAVTFPGVAEEGREASRVREFEPTAGRRFASADSLAPATHLLSNGRYTVMITAAGSGQSRWRDIAVNRWREDSTCDEHGSFVYLRDTDSGDVWSAGLQPTGHKPDNYSVLFNEDRAEFTRTDGDLATAMTVLVSAEDDSEVRRISIANSGRRARTIEVTSYVELALAPQAADIAHPVFSKLFVETEWLADSGALLAHRRQREPDEPELWAAHLAVVDGQSVGNLAFETDRAHFLGRGNSPRSPRSVVDGRSLSGSIGTVLDPIFALRARIRIAPGETAHMTYWTMVASSRDKLLDLIDKNRSATAFERAAALAWTQAQVQLHHLRLSAGDAGEYQSLASHILYASPGLRAPSEVIRLGAAPQQGLWSLGISGDLPIVLLRVGDVEHLGAARDLLQATDYWRMKGLAFDVVILNERGTSYIQDLQNHLDALVRASQARAQFGERPLGDIFVLRSDLIPPATRALLLSVARVVLVGKEGRLASQADGGRALQLARPPFAPRTSPSPSLPVAARPPELEYFNGLGGFAENGREYVVILRPGQVTPAPWINVIANPTFGFQVSAEGSGYSWSINSREHQLTPWSNDPVADPPGQLFYVRDEDSGECWSPTAAPLRDEQGPYIARHGRGYSRFEHNIPELGLELLEYVPLADPVKISRLTIHNRGNRRRRLSVTAFVAWVLGPSRSAAAPFTMTAIDEASGAMFATNRWAEAFAGRVAFIDLGGRQTSWTGDRREFIGRNGSLARPAALATPSPLSNRVGAGLDPCGALQTEIELGAGASIELVCLLGEAASADEAARLIGQYREADLDAVLGEVKDFWDGLCGAVQVKTPDRALDIMLNGWLLYQTLVCRIWARSAFYQASGAYGFRDQLQDVMAIAAIKPQIARDHLLRAAARQFVEGDVQHWWLPHSGQGVRTRFSDDRIWLALVTAHYLQVTGDQAVLDEPVGFLSGPALAPGSSEHFFMPDQSGETASLYEHCARALDASLAVGAHGIPLIGSGDWNDGFNRVGHRGKGESVWLGWFLHAALSALIPVARDRGDDDRVDRWNAHCDALRDSLEREAWDGDWYRRGWYDDGSPLGSAASAECRIDSIAQSWAAISGVGERERVTRAMAAVERELIDPETGLAMLFAPPFDHSLLDPGYVKGYPPGIRENGGQYTHAALWSVIAWARLGQGDKAAALLSMLNPINHSETRSEAHTYKLEPYVVAADIYSQAPHIGRGGWSWYTGAAGWMQRAGIEAVLGLRIEGQFIHLDPCVPKHWRGYEINLAHGTDRYRIRIDNPHACCCGIASANYDGESIVERPLRLAIKGDGQRHEIRLTLGPAAVAAIPLDATGQ